MKTMFYVVMVVCILLTVVSVVVAGLASVVAFLTHGGGLYGTSAPERRTAAIVAGVSLLVGVGSVVGAVSSFRLARTAQSATPSKP